MILFYSDYLEGCHPSILNKLQETNLHQTPGYGEDDFCGQAKETIKNICEAPGADVHFLVGGTQTNMTVIAASLRPHQGVLCASSGHINVHETGAIEHSGHKVLPLPAKDGKVCAQDVCAALEAHYSDPSFEHTVQPGMLYISFPTELGTIYSKKELLEIKKVCSDWEIPLFIDGARLGYGLEAEGCDLLLKDIAQIADVFYIGGTKQGALFGEAVVICNEKLKTDFRYFIKQNGGMLAKGRLLGIQFDALMKEGLYFSIARDAVRKAQRISEAFRKKGYDFLVESPTNQIFPILPKEDEERLSSDFGFEEWQKIDADHIGVRFCTSWATTDEQVDALISAI
ncbi:MAG: beta-eliminating lyase-related protein [Bacteroidales bacterium]|nr:beta-eliminating lyase-related protein [Bacteroidales bacterium]